MTISEIPGVQIASNPTGELNEITINLKEHPEAIKPLKEIGLILKTQFDIDFEEGHTLDELETYLTDIVKQHYADKRKVAGI